LLGPPMSENELLTWLSTCGDTPQA